MEASARSRSCMYWRMASRSSSLTVRSSYLAAWRRRRASGGGRENVMVSLFRDILGVIGAPCADHYSTLSYSLSPSNQSSIRRRSLSLPGSARVRTCNISQPCHLLQADRGIVITALVGIIGNHGYRSVDALGHGSRHLCPYRTKAVTRRLRLAFVPGWRTCRVAGGLLAMMA